MRPHVQAASVQHRRLSAGTRSIAILGSEVEVSNPISRPSMLVNSVQIHWISLKDMYFYARHAA